MATANDILLIDGKHALWRSADAHGDLGIESPNGFVPTGAIYGFLTILCRAYTSFGGKVMVCWDDWKHGPKYRRKMYPGYKYREPPDPLDYNRTVLLESMAKQQQGLMGFLSACGIFQVWSPGWEADDVIGTLSHRFGDHKIGILSGDRDMMQCVNENVTLIRPQPQGEFKLETPETIVSEWGVDPARIPDLKALMGDKGDCIPGCSGIGKKYAAKILEAFTNVSHAVSIARSDSDEWPTGLRANWRGLIADQHEIILLSRRLAEINRTVPLKFLAKAPDRQRVTDLCVRLKFKTILIGGRLDALFEMGAAG